jgi:hypothetical protein
MIVSTLTVPQRSSKSGCDTGDKQFSRRLYRAAYRSHVSLIIRGTAMNPIIYVVGLIVVVIAILSFFGLR